MGQFRIARSGKTGRYQPAIEHLESRVFLSATTGTIASPADVSDPLIPIFAKIKIPGRAAAGTDIHGGVTLNITNDTQAEIVHSETITTYVSLSQRLETDAIQVGTPIVVPIDIKPGKSINVIVPIDTLPQVPASGDYHFLINFTAEDASNFVVATPGTTNIGPAIAALSETVTAVKLPPAVVSNHAVKGAVALAVTNDGHIAAQGMAIFNITASTVSGTPGTVMGTLSKEINLPAGKVIHVVVPITAIPLAADGDYFIVAQVMDPSGAASVASSAATINIAAPFVSLTATLGRVKAVASGDILTLTNNGNVEDVTTLHETIGYSSDSLGTQPAGGTNAVTGKTMHIKAGKSVKMHANGWKTITSGLVTGNSYFLTVTVTDDNGHAATAVSANSFVF